MASSKTIPESAQPGGESSRVRLRAESAHVGFVDGGWWPRSRDLPSEMLPLLATLAADGFDVRRMVYDMSAWDTAPRKLKSGGHVVKLDGFRTGRPNMVGLIDATRGRRLDLVVVPSDTESVAAESALTMAALDGDLHSGSEIVHPETAAP